MEASPEGASGETGPEAPPLDTLAQLDQWEAGGERQNLKHRARAKYLSVPIAIDLAELRSPLEKRYRNTIYCAGTLEQDPWGQIRGRYCGNRWCLVCNRVRIARAINRYLPVIVEWEDPQLVTLTLPNVPAAILGDTIRHMLRDLARIGRAIRRTDKLRIRALRKLECTYNPERDDYHPHFHIAVEGREAAVAMVRRWLEMHHEASRAAQDIRKCDGNSLKELFKYFTKLIAKRREASATRSVAPAAALDVIFSAMVGRRVYQPMGFKVATTPGQHEDAEVGTTAATNTPARHGEEVVWQWLQQAHDWIDLETGDVLSGYEPTAKYVQLVESIAERSGERPIGLDFTTSPSLTGG